MNPTHLNPIDSYLRNELSPAELSAFEQLMNTDPTFYQQVKFQEAVRDGLAQYRKAELKARLDAIEVAPGWFGQMGSTAVKILAGAVGATLVGVMGYLTYSDHTVRVNPSSSAGPEKMVLTDHPAESESGQVIIPETEPATPTLEETPEAAGKSSETEPATSQRSTAAVQASAAERQAKSGQSDFIPQVVVPQPDEMVHGETFVSPDAEMPDMSLTDEVAIKEASVPVTVETIQKRSETLKYKYFEGKLFLYGDFSEQPYEILEINSPTSRKLYLYHNSRYYGLLVTDKVHELEPIGDKKLLDELKILRNNKL